MKTNQFFYFYLILIFYFLNGEDEIKAKMELSKFIVYTKKMFVVFPSKKKVKFVYFKLSFIAPTFTHRATFLRTDKLSDLFSHSGSPLM